MDSPVSPRRALAATLLALVPALASVSPAGPVAQAAARGIVCLDPGHGGSDPGAVYSDGTISLKEAHETFVIAGLLKSKLEAAGFTVVVTRANESDNPTNTQRAQSCNAAGAGTVLSIHLNGATEPGTDYFRAYWGKKNKDATFTQTVWDNYALPQANADGTTGPGVIRKISVTNFASGVLLKSNAPAALAETVFITNTGEAKLLAAGAAGAAGTRQQQIADQLYAGLNAWYTNPGPLAHGR